MEEPERSEIYESFAIELPFGVLLLDSTMNAVCWNRRAEQITGFLRHEVVGRACRELSMFGCEGRDHRGCDSQQCPWRSMMHHIRISAPHYLMQHKDGHSVPVILTLLQLPVAGGHAGAAIIFQEQGASREMRLWMAQGLSHTEDEFGLPSIAETRDELQLSTGRTSAALLLIEVEDSEQMARHFGRELLHSVMRNLVRSVSQTLEVPHFLGHWSGKRLLLLVPNCDPETAKAIARRLEIVSQKNGVRWWGDIVTLRVRVHRIDVEESDTAETLEEKLDQGSAKPTPNQE